MKNVVKFSRKDGHSLIVIPCELDDDELSFALDTGASHTVVDLTALLVAGYEIKDALYSVQLETGKGVVEAHVFKIRRFQALGMVRKNVEICTYDFMANQVMSEFHGVLGLDFFPDSELTINFKRSEIVLTQL